MTTTRESLATAKELFRKITSRVDVDEVLEIALALDAVGEECIVAASNAPCNQHAKYTCCLENGLNARNIIVEAIRQRGRKV